MTGSPPPRPARRRLIECAAAGVLGPVSSAFAASHASAPARADPGFAADVEIELTAIVAPVVLRDGPPTRMWRFDGRVVQGDSTALTWLGPAAGQFIPVIRVRRGQRLRVTFDNRLPEPTIVHWHGLHVPQPMDGHPMYEIGGGQRYVYEYVVDNRAGTYWFHPHPHGRTGWQVYSGLAGLFLVGDDEEDAAGLPRGEFDLPMVLQDRSFDAGNQLVYLGRGMMERMMGLLGEQVLVNGSGQWSAPVRRGGYRLRLFNGSNATSYWLGLSADVAMTVIGTDGGLLERPVPKRRILLGPAERADVWVDFSRVAVGDEVALLADSYAPNMNRVTGFQRGASVVEGGRPVARFRVSPGAADVRRPPARLSRWPSLLQAEAWNAQRPRPFRLAMMGPSATINGRAFDGHDMQAVGADEIVKLGATEVWEFSNDAGTMMQMAHPMHVHNLSFRVLERSGAVLEHPLYRLLSAGFTDEGLKDTVMVMPGERVRVLLRFEDHVGVYLLHCHILEHEDMGMMRNYRVDAAS